MVTVIDENGDSGPPALIMPGEQVKEEEEQ